MDKLPMSAEFLLTSLIVVVIPGTGVLYTLAIGLGRGFKASIAAALGCTFGIVPHVLASILGLAAILHTSAVLFQAVKYAGVAYLLYMAWSILKEGGALDVSADRQKSSYFETARRGTLINVLNPKLSLFFLAFLPQFVPASSSSPTFTMIMMALVFMALTFAVFVLYGGCASLARTYIISRPSVMVWLRRGFAATFAALGLRLAFAER